MVTILLDACAGLGTETGGGTRAEVFVMYRSEADPEIEVDLY